VIQLNIENPKTKRFVTRARLLYFCLYWCHVV